MRDAIQLVREKFLQEQGRAETNQDVAAEYGRACEEYPASMKIAHIIWGMEFAGD